jgi:1,6-anhydro-N-acetylmuramate kinase
MRVLGILSSTSLDGLDYALCEVTARGVKLRSLWSAQFLATPQLGEPACLAERLRAPVVGNFRAADIAAADKARPSRRCFTGSCLRSAASTCV